MCGLTLLWQMDEYYATADRNAMYVRGDATLRREAERLGMGYGGKGRWPRFGGAGAENMKGNAGAWRDGDPRGLDGHVGVFEDEGEGEGTDGELRQEPRWQQQQGGEEERNKREKEEEEEELARSPLRAKARKAAQEISQVYLLRMGRGAGGSESASASASKA